MDIQRLRQLHDLLQLSAEIFNEYEMDEHCEIISLLGVHLNILLEGYENNTPVEELADNEILVGSQELIDIIYKMIGASKAYEDVKIQNDINDMKSDRL